MRASLVVLLVTLLVASLVHAQTSAATSSGAPAASSSASATSAAASPTPSDTPAAACAKQNNCGQDVACLARCNNVPNPTVEDINRTTECVRGCMNMTGEAAVRCQNDCVSRNYMTYGTLYATQSVITTGVNGTMTVPSRSGTAAAGTGKASAASVLERSGWALSIVIVYAFMAL
ncbi:uncharacterized protein VTP21DRAFT_1085 [Calcarisporiella thermophila]|uniref:uncharacterized protein n=1 Tax=Calcarisporiella thermophila TaxID=911321 RepID=UPI0037446AB0